MIARYSLILGSCLIAATTAHASTRSDPFVERDGYLIFEVESEPATGDWMEAGDIEGHAGDAYYIWSGRNNFARSEAALGDPIRYHFRITTPGNYQLRWRSRNTVGLDGTEHNDSWVRFPTGRNIDGEHGLFGWTKAYMGQVARWTWDAYTADGKSLPVRQYFDAGEHVIDIAGRSSGHALDRIALLRYESVPFSADELDSRLPSPRVSQASADGHVHAGDTCVGNTLSLSADRAASLADGALVDTHATLPFGGGDAYALLQFDLERVPRDALSVELRLASDDGPLAVDAYLASDARWSDDSTSGDLPYPAALLGQSDMRAGPVSRRSVTLDGTLLPRITHTIVLASGDSSRQAVHGIGTPLEPRLSVTVPGGHCDTFDARADDDAAVSDEDDVPPTNDGEGGDDEGGDDVNRDDASLHAAAGDGDASPRTPEGGDVAMPGDDAAGELQTDARSPIGDGDESEGDDGITASPFDVIDVDDDRTADRHERWGGGVSLWALSLLVLLVPRSWRRQGHGRPRSRAATTSVLSR